MTNNEEKCLYCDTFDLFQELLGDGMEFKEAFHTALESFEDIAMPITYEDGLLDGLKIVNDNVSNMINKIEKPCDCDECRAEREKNEYS